MENCVRERRRDARGVRGRACGQAVNRRVEHGFQIDKSLTAQCTQTQLATIGTVRNGKSDKVKNWKTQADYSERANAAILMLSA